MCPSSAASVIHSADIRKGVAGHWHAQRQVVQPGLSHMTAGVLPCSGRPTDVYALGACLYTFAFGKIPV